VRELLLFVKDFGAVSCATCRRDFEAQDRVPPCEKKGCPYTPDGSEPPTERGGLAALAWRLWNEKEALGAEVLAERMKAMPSQLRELLRELVLFVEVEARKLGLKKTSFEEVESW